MPRKQEKASGGAPEWMCTFSDMMSLLLCFFVLLFAMSSTEKMKMIQASGSLRAAFGGLPAPYLVENIPDMKQKPELSRPPQTERKQFYGKDELLREEEHKFRSRNLQEVIQVTGTEQGITFRLSGDLTFEKGSSELTAAGILALLFITDELNQFPKNPVKIVGHTDASPHRGDPNRNWTLAADRAYAVMEYITKIGTRWGRVAQDRCTYESFGQYAPLPDVNPNTVIGMTLNRRVEITLIQTDEGNGTFYTDSWIKNPRTPLMNPDNMPQAKGE
ncbi:MAG: flagellar motor protein MotB [Candidatus Omnitrophota bacterium]